MTGVAPLVALAFACLAGALWSYSVAWAVGSLFAAFLFCRTNWKWWLAIPVLAAAVAYRSGKLEQPVRESLATPSSRYVEGILKVGRPSGGFSDERFGWFQSDEGEIKVLIIRAENYSTGEVLKVQGKIFVPSAERNPGTYSRLDQWRRNGVHGGFVVTIGKSLGLRWQSAPLRQAERLRDGLSEAIVRGLPEDSKGREVILAMVLGQKPPRDSEVSRAFRESGAMHVFAVSGLHVTLVGTLCWLVLANLPIPRRVSMFFVIFAMITYAFVTGVKPPAVRATLMAVCLLGAFLVRRRPSLFNALALSFILVVIWKPSQIFEVGFQLSYGVLTAIGLGVGLAYRFTGKIAELDPFFPSRLMTDGQRRRMSFRRYFASLGASSIAAWIGSLPLMIWHFGMVTPVAVLTSLLLIPMTLAILGLAFFGALVGTVSTKAGEWTNRANGFVASGAYHSASGFSRIPGGHWSSRRLIPADWIVFDPANGGAASFLDVEGGAMIDVGGRRFYYDELRNILNRWNAGLDTVVLSHPDGDHVGAMPLLLERGGLARAIMPTLEARSPSFREFIANAEQGGCELHVGKTGERFALGEGVSLEIIREGQPPSRGIADNRIMVMRVHWKGWKVLVTSDLGLEDELALIESGVDLSADVILMGRHAWGVSGQAQFLKAVGAKVVITSYGSFPPFETPKPQWIQMVGDSGCTLFNQGDTGAVLMDFTDEKLVVKSFLKPEQKIELQR